MQKVRTMGLLVGCLALMALLAPTQASAADDGTVAFKNMTAETQYILVMYGDGASCADKAQKEQLTVEPGDSVTVESGDSKVCWCSSTVGKIGSCSPWSVTKAGKVQKIR